jgi:hypothetical protein
MQNKIRFAASIPIGIKRSIAVLPRGASVVAAIAVGPYLERADGLFGEHSLDAKSLPQGRDETKNPNIDKLCA